MKCGLVLLLLLASPLLASAQRSNEPVKCGVCTESDMAKRDADDDSDLQIINGTTTGYYYEGDQLFPVSIREERRKRQLGLIKRSSLDLNHYGVWPGGVVRYLLDKELRGHEATMEKALKEFSDATGGCIQFKRLTRPPADQLVEPYVQVYNGYGCESNVGFTPRKSKDSKPGYVSLNARNCMHTTAIQHEFMHTLGYEHEHNRADRDEHIRVNWKYFSSPKQCSGFHKCHGCSSEGFPYDIKSIVQYQSGRVHPQCTNGEKNAFDQVTLDGERISQPPRVSEMDVKKIHKRYQCKKQGSKYVSQIPTTVPKKVFCGIDSTKLGVVINEMHNKYGRPDYFSTQGRQKHVNEMLKELNKLYNEPGCSWTVVMAGEPPAGKQVDETFMFKFWPEMSRYHASIPMNNKYYKIILHHPAPPKNVNREHEAIVKKFFADRQSKAKSRAWCDELAKEYEANRNKQWDAPLTEDVQKMFKTVDDIYKKGRDGHHALSKARALVQSGVMVATYKSSDMVYATDGKLKIDYTAGAFPEYEAMFLN